MEELVDYENKKVIGEEIVNKLGKEETARKIEENKIINRALQLALWRKQHQYCGQCGKATNFHDEESALYCKPCHLFYYPKI